MPLSNAAPVQALNSSADTFNVFKTLHMNISRFTGAVQRGLLEVESPHANLATWTEAAAISMLPAPAAAFWTLSPISSNSQP
jgi:hypothetical protein